MYIITDIKCGFNHAHLAESQHEARQANRGTWRIIWVVGGSGNHTVWFFKSLHTKWRANYYNDQSAHSSHSSTKIRHKHTRTFSVQLRAATAGACCWSVDCSCLPRYSLWKRKTIQNKNVTVGALPFFFFFAVSNQEQIFVVISCSSRVWVCNTLNIWASTGHNWQVCGNERNSSVTCHRFDPTGNIPISKQVNHQLATTNWRQQILVFADLFPSPFYQSLCTEAAFKMGTESCCGFQSIFPGTICWPRVGTAWQNRSFNCNKLYNIHPNHQPLMHSLTGWIL